MTNDFRGFDKNSSDEESGMSDDDAGISEFSSDSDENEPTQVEETNSMDDDDDDEDEVVKAIKAEKNKPRDHPPTILCDDFIVDISFHPSRNLIALGNISGDVLLYEYSNEETKLINTLELHLNAIRDVEFDDDGATLFSAAKDKSIMATDVETGKLKQCFESAHEEPVYRLLCLNNNKIVTGDDGGTVKLWDMRQPDPVFSIKIGEEHVSDMITNDAQKYLEFGLHSDEYIGQKHSIQCMVPITQNIVVTSGEDGILRASHMFPQRQLGIVGQHKLPVENLDISHDGQYIASCSHDNDVKFWNISYFESVDELIDVNKKQNKKKDMSNNLPSSSVKNASDFFSGLV
ncbi:WD-repeat protein [Operophtera brumata]|uniref:WD repeat-containing protein 55 homolog n=1 Tax=Operophtera brumata TaxID=104452 RepID=A0A0L7LM93_OPEBR|nr:WD-repeat protein [Operophtera brumata]